MKREHELEYPFVSASKNTDVSASRSPGSDSQPTWRSWVRVAPHGPFRGASLGYVRSSPPFEADQSEFR